MRAVSVSFILATALSALAADSKLDRGDVTRPQTTNAPARMGRPVRVLSLSFHNKSREEIARLVDREAGVGTDLVVLPETWLGQKDDPESLDGLTVTTFGALAKKHHTYIVCPIDRRDGKRRLNSAVLLDRSGQVAGLYDKVFPYWSEFDLK
jgi:apolipoprotein N-acyltransferase